MGGLWFFFIYLKKTNKMACASQISEIEDPALLKSTSERYDMWVVPLKVLLSRGLKFCSERLWLSTTPILWRSGVVCPQC